MDKKTQAQILRDDPAFTYNCCQTVLLTYAGQCGLTREQALALGANFGTGMRHGSTCGAVSGALMVLGMLGRGDQAALALLKGFRAQNTYLDCAHLLQKAKQEGEARKPHCDRMVSDAVELLEALL